MARRSWPAVLVGVLWLVPAPSALALIGDVPTIRAAAVVRSELIPLESEVVALIGETPTGTHQLVLRTIRRENGALVRNEVVTLPDGVVPVDLLFSTVFRPNSILVLDEALRIHEFPLAFDASGAAKLVGTTPTILGSFGDPATLGAGTALAEAPGVIDPMTDGFLGVGTSGGRLLIATGVVDAADYMVDLGKGAITGLATVPQVGRFVFVAAHNGRAVGVSTGGSSTQGASATPPSVVFDLADPRPDPFLDLGAVFEPNGEPMKSPAPVSFVAANGTPRVAMLRIPANPTIGGTLRVGGISGVDLERQRLDERELVLGLRLGRCDDGMAQRRDLEVIGIAAKARHVGFHLCVGLARGSRFGLLVKMSSPHRTAKRRPRPLCPAWMTTGWPWGERGTVKGPRER